jgi:LuxR family transcriptional regulator, maltose regulon positive regulatory protein
LERGDGPTSTPVSTPLGSKFRVPVARRGMVRRAGLADRLLAADEPVISVVAPPGYGKTTLLAQWAERRSPRVAWISCEGTDNDPVALWSALIKALNAIGPVDSAATRQLATSGSGIGGVPGFVAAIELISATVTVVLDHLEVISSKECQAAIAEFALRVPQGWQLAMASRERLPIPDARLRAERRIVEIDVADLAMAGNEARALLSGAGCRAQRSKRSCSERRAGRLGSTSLPLA